MRLFLKFVFTEAPPQILQEMKRFASVKDSSKFSALCDLTSFFLNFLFFKGFPLKKMGFLLFPVGEEWFSRHAYLFGDCFLAIFGLILAMFLTSQPYDFDAFAHAGAPLGVE